MSKGFCLEMILPMEDLSSRTSGILQTNCAARGYTVLDKTGIKSNNTVEIGGHPYNVIMNVYSKKQEDWNKIVLLI